MILAMTSPTPSPLSEVYNLADQVLGQRLSQVDGVSQVSISAAEPSPPYASRSILPCSSSMGMSMEDIRSVVSQVNVDSPKGARISNGARELRDRQ